MKKILIFLLVLFSINSFSQTGIWKYEKYIFNDSVYFRAVPYNSGAGIVHLGIDTVAASPTFGKLVRKTAGGATPTLQQVFNTEVGGSVLTKTDTINTGSDYLRIIGSGAVFSLFATNSGGGKSIVGSTTASSGNAVEGNAGSGFGIRGTTISGTAAADFATGASSGSNIVNVASFQANSSSSSGSNGSGGQILYGAESSTTENTTAARFQWYYPNATHASRTVIQNWLSYSNAIEDTVMALGGYVNLTESSATKFTSTTLATGKIQGGSILVTVEANDATDYQSRTLRFIWSAVNKAGTLTITISTPEEVVAVSSGTLTVTITAVDAGSGVLDFKANAVSSLTQSTLRATYQTFKNF